jgi:hypothetical protein
VKEGLRATCFFERCADHLSRKHSARITVTLKIVPREGLPTIREVARLLVTSPFVGTNPTDEPLISGLPVT